MRGRYGLVPLTAENLNDSENFQLQKFKNVPTFPSRANATAVSKNRQESTLSKKQIFSERQ